MKCFLALLIVSLAILTPSTQALDENIFLSLTPGAERCIDLVLPDDIGYTGGERSDFVVRNTILGFDTNLREQTVRTGENNTIIIPICFSAAGKASGTCSEKFKISVSSPVAYKEWDAGVCVSTYPDVDYVQSVSQKGNVSDVLNDNFDLFSISLKESKRVSAPGGKSTFILLLQSYADITLQLEAVSFLPITPAKTSVSTSAASPYKEVEFSVSAPKEEGEYELKIKAGVSSCNSDFCKKSVTGILLVSNQSKEASFALTLFPKNINIEELDEVELKYSVFNNGEPANFSARAVFPEGVRHTFTEGTFTLSTMEEKTFSFRVLPANPDTIYEIKLYITSGTTTKSSSSYISANEMLTDVLREAGDTPGPAVEKVVDGWKSVKESTTYGKDLSEYEKVKVKLDVAKAGGETNEAPPVEESVGPNVLPFVLVPVVLAIALLTIWFFRKSGTFTRESGISRD